MVVWQSNISNKTLRNRKSIEQNSATTLDTGKTLTADLL